MTQKQDCNCSSNGWDFARSLIAMIGFILFCTIVASCQLARQGKSLW